MNCPRELRLKKIIRMGRKQAALGTSCVDKVIDLSPPSDYLLSDMTARVNANIRMHALPENHHAMTCYEGEMREISGEEQGG